MLSSEHIFPLIMKHGVLEEKLAFVHRMLMVEAVNTTMGGIAQEMHDEVLGYILQVPCHWHTSFCANLFIRLVCTYFCELVYSNGYYSRRVVVCVL